jgi:hypothetical protein
MSETVPAFGRAEWCAFLNRMLEAERAGARALLEFLGEYPRDGKAWKALRKVQGDEAHNCVLLGDLLKRAGEPYSHATGEFLDKALALQGRRARLEFLCRGLGWSVREIEAALPRVPDEAGLKALGRIRDTHRGSLASCNSLLQGKDL